MKRIGNLEVRSKVFDAQSQASSQTVYTFDDLISKLAFFRVVEDNALSDIAIFQYSFVVIEPRSSYAIGDVIYCVYEGQYYLRQLSRDESGGVLRARNPEFKDIKIHEHSGFQIVGKVIFSMYFHDTFTPLQTQVLEQLLDTSKRKIK